MYKFQESSLDNDTEVLVTQNPSLINNLSNLSTVFPQTRRKVGFGILFLAAFLTIVIFLVIVFFWTVSGTGPGSLDPPACPLHGRYVTFNDGTKSLECFPGYAVSSETNCRGGPSSCKPAVAVLIGGNMRDEDVKVEIYAPDGLCNRYLPSLPLAREDHAAVWFNSGIVTCGSDEDDAEVTGTCVELSLGKQPLQWREHSRLARPRWWHASVVIKQNIYLIGGGDKDTMGTTEVWDGKRWSSGPKLMENSYGSCAAKISSDAFILTGGKYSMTSTWLYNVTTDTWLSLGDMVGERKHHGCVFVNTERGEGVLVAGGRSSAARLDSAEFLDTKKWVWSSLGSMSHSRNVLQLAVVGGDSPSILALAGHDDEDNYRDTVDKFHANKATWTPAKVKLKESRDSFALAEVPHTKSLCGQ